VVSFMDDDTAELIALLYTRIGMIMEDASVIALTLGGPRSGFSEEALAELERAFASMSSLLAAASSLRR